jgi:SAM-dependent methyltransferase
MDDPTARTVASYERLAGEYRERHDDRSVVADGLDRFDAALGEARGGDSDARAGGTARVLDVGCGPGWESATLAERGHDVLALDITRAFLDQTAAVAPAADRARADMRSLPVADGTADGLWACASFLHVPRADAPGTLDEFRRVLRPGGVLFCAVRRGEGDRESEASAYEADDERRFTPYDPDSLRSLVVDAGFTVDALTEDGDWLQVLARARTA